MFRAPLLAVALAIGALSLAQDAQAVSQPASQANLSRLA